MPIASDVARRRIALAGAATLSLIGIGMAAASAVERGVTAVDRVLIVACAVAITLAAHLLPALTRRAAGWALWSACVLLTIYGHAAFFAAASSRAGEHRAMSVAPTSESSALREQLRGTAARASSAVAADLAAARSRVAGATLQLARCDHEQPGRCAVRRVALQQAEQLAQALQIESDEAQQATAFRSRLTAEAAQLDSKRAAAAAGLAGIGADGVVLAMSVLSAVVVELLAALLWAEVLASSPAAAQAARAPARRSAVRSPAAAAAASAADKPAKPVLVATSTRWPASTAPGRRKAPS